MTRAFLPTPASPLRQRMIDDMNVLGFKDKSIHSARATAWLRALVSSSRVRVHLGVKLAMLACGRGDRRAMLGDRCY